MQNRHTFLLLAAAALCSLIGLSYSNSDADPSLAFLAAGQSDSELAAAAAAGDLLSGVDDDQAEPPAMLSRAKRAAQNQRDNLIVVGKDCTYLYAEWEASSITVMPRETEPGKTATRYTGTLKKPTSKGRCMNVTTSAGKRHETLQNITLTWTGVSMQPSDKSKSGFTINTLSVTMFNSLKLTKGYWIIEGVNATIQGGGSVIPGGQITVPLESSFMTAAYDTYRPDKFSFSCLELGIKTRPFIAGDKPTPLRVKLNLHRFQIQPFKVKKGRFETSFDCSTWFTIPLWMGFFTVLMFIIIISVGTYLLSSINTMDRFENPKGKPLQIKAD